MTVSDDDFADIRRRLEQDPHAGYPAKLLKGLAAYTSRTLAYTQATAAVTLTHTTEATADALVTAAAVTLDGITDVLVTFYAPRWTNNAGANRTITVALYQDTGGGAASIGLMGTSFSGNVNPNTVGALEYRIAAPAAGTYTFSARGYINNATGNSTIDAGAGGVGNNVPMFIRVSNDTLAS